MLKRRGIYKYQNEVKLTYFISSKFDSPELVYEFNNQYAQGISDNYEDKYNCSESKGNNDSLVYFTKNPFFEKE